MTLSAWGDGDAFSTPSAGPPPRTALSAPPAARLALLADHDGVVDSYGVELVLDHLAATPATATASITLWSAGGGEHTFAVPGEPALGCPEGTVSWNAAPPVGQEAIAAVGGQAAAMSSSSPTTWW